MGLTDIDGQRFGSLIALKREGSAAVHVRCDCGVEKVVHFNNLRAGRTVSCGCEGWGRLAALHRTHGLSKTPEYRTWSGIITRCENPKAQAFPYYGGRGVSMCPRWRDDFAAFLADIGPRPSAAHSIDRIDNCGNYEPGNCRWATRTQQSRNRGNTRFVVAGGIARPLMEWAEVVGIHPGLIRRRLRVGWNPDDAVKPAGWRRAL